MEDIKTLWDRLIYDFARIKTLSDQTESGYPVFIGKANEQIQKCYGALSTLEDGIYAIDGGDPFTQIIDSATDVNGGYPGL